VPTGEKEWLVAAGIRPRKRLGQNFLMDPRIPLEIARRGPWIAGDSVIEIGAGSGALTAALLKAGLLVTAIEMDETLAAILESRFAEQIARGVLRVARGDVLSLDLGGVDQTAATSDEQTAGGGPAAQVVSGASHPASPDARRVWLAGNLPYGVTTPILLKAFSQRDRVAGAVFMVQREYGERLLARAGEDAYGSLSVWTAAHATSRLLLRVGRSSFWPRPGVESVVVELLFPHVPAYAGSYPRLERVLRAAFGQRRKTLENALSHNLPLPKDQVRRVLIESGVDPSARAETLPLESFASIVTQLPEELWATR
jgi:16S rRNA (adenine1518-N6/adenine1519-N6)-dimethyltransferase